MRFIQIGPLREFSSSPIIWMLLVLLNFATLVSPQIDCGVQTDLVFLLDSSTSVGKDGFQNVLRFVIGMLRHADINSGNVRVGLMTYQTKPNIRFHLKKYKTIGALEKAILSVNYKAGGTNAALALKQMRESMFTQSSGDRPKSPNVAILITDGVSNFDAERTIPEALASHQKGIHIFVVGIGLTETLELEQMATPPGKENLFLIKSFDELTLDDIGTKTFQKMCGMVVSNGQFTSAIPTTVAIKVSDSYIPVVLTNSTLRPTTNGGTRSLPRLTKSIVSTSPRIQMTTTEIKATTTSGIRTTTSKYVCRGSADLVWILDSSGSVGPANFYRMLEFVVNLTSHLDIEANMYRVALITFSDHERVEFDLANRTREEVLQKINGARYSYGSTNTYSALHRMRTDILNVSGGENRPGIPDLCIIITDGQSNINSERTVHEARLAKRQGVVTAGIGINLPSRKEIDDIVSEPISKFSMVLDDFDGLQTLQSKLVQLLCHSNDQCARNPCKNGATCSSAFDEYFCKCPLGFTGRDCHKSCQAKTDVVFVLDSSGSVGEENFQKMKEFLKKFLNEVNVESCDFRVGVLKFGSSAFVQFHLNAFTTTEQLSSAIDKIRYSHGYTYMADAVRVARETMFQTNRGDRPNARNVLVLLSEGQANVRPTETLNEVRKSRNAGIYLIPIGIGSNNRAELNAMASNSLGMFFADSFSQLKNLTMTVADYILEDVDDCLPNPCHNGGICEDKIHAFVCRCSPSFTGPVCSRECNRRSDVAFLIDTTAFVGRENFEKVKDFVKNLINRLPLCNGESRIGLVTFSGIPQIRRRLNEPTSRDDVIGAINSLHYDGGYPSTSDALDLLSYELFTEDHGDRPDVRNYAVLITAGSLFSEFELPRIQQPKYSGIHVFGIGIGLQEGDKRRMIEIVSDANASAFTVDDLERLNGTADKIAETICNDPDMCSSAPCQNGGMCIDAVNSFTCRCIAGYAGRKCERVCNSRIDLAILLDSSGSVGQVNFARALDFISSLIAEFNVGSDYTRVALISFNTKAKVVFYLDSHRSLENLQRAIHGVQFAYGDSNAADAFRLARESVFIHKHGDRSDINNMIVLLTDGESNISPERTISEAKKCREAGIHIMSVGIGLESTEEVKKVASETINPNNVLLVDSFEKLDDILLTLVEAICDDEDSCQTNNCLNGGKCVDGIRSYECLCSDGFSGIHCEKDYTNLLDLVFIVDSSISVGISNFAKTVDFISGIVKSLPIDSHQARVAVVTYSNAARARMYLSSFVTKSELIRRIRNLEYDRGTMTNAAEAIRVAREDIFNGYRGDRPYAANVLIMITDGVSNLQPQKTRSEAQNARDAGIHMYAIGIGLNVSREVDGIAPNENSLILIDSYDDLKKLEESILDKMSELKPLVPITSIRPLSTTVEARTGRLTSSFATRITTKIVVGTTASSIETTLSPTKTILRPTLAPGEICSRKLDLVFAFDSSGSLPESAFKRAGDFASQLVKQFQFGKDAAQFGAFSFTENIRVAFHLKQQSVPQKKFHLVLYRPSKHNEKQVRKAMQTIRDTMFIERNGDRRNVPNIALIITDGFTAADKDVFAEEYIITNEQRGIEVLQIVWNQAEDEFPSNEKIFFVDSASTLMGITNKVKQTICDMGVS